MRKLTNDELGRLDLEGFKSSGKNPVVVVLDNIRSLNNIGSIFRTCDAFRVEKIILCGISTPPPHREIHKTALGAEFSVDWVYFESTNEAITLLKNDGYQVMAVEQTTDSIPLDQAMTVIRRTGQSIGAGSTTHNSQLRTHNPQIATGNRQPPEKNPPRSPLYLRGMRLGPTATGNRQPVTSNQQLPYHFPQHHPHRHRHIQGVLGAVLGYFDGGIAQVDHLL